MNKRIVGVIVVVATLALGIWLASNRDQPGTNGEIVAISESDLSRSSDTTDTAPPAARVESPQKLSSPPAPAGHASNPASGIGASPAPGTGASPPAAGTTQSIPPRPLASATNAGASVTSQPPTTTVPMVSSPPPAGADALAVSTEAVAIDVDKVTLSLRDYRTIMGENPTGTNAEIAAALNGGNPKQARLLHEGLTQNSNGEIVDRWGTPYFFHQLSRDQMQIRSAGPDRKMWTDDDIFGN